MQLLSLIGIYLES